MLSGVGLGMGRDLGERGQAGETSRGLAGLRPRHLDPVLEREEMVVRASQVRGEDQGQAADRAVGWQAADLAAASRALVPASTQLAVARAETHAFVCSGNPRREAHHQERGLRLLRVSRDRRGRQGHKQFPKMLLVQRNVVVASVACIGTRTDFRQDLHLRRQTHDKHADAICDQGFDGLVDISRVAGQQSPGNDQDFAGSMGWGVVQRSSRHLQRVLQTRVALSLVVPDLLDVLDMVGGVSTHVTDANRDPIAHAEDTQVRDRVLLEELGDELRGIATGEDVSCRSEVFLHHGKREIQDQHEVANDASLQWRRIS